MAKGYTNPDIATELGITIDGAKWHVREILSNLGADSREQAVAAWKARDRTPLAALFIIGGAAATAAAFVVGVSLWIAFDDLRLGTYEEPNAASP